MKTEPVSIHDQMRAKMIDQIRSRGQTVRDTVPDDVLTKLWHEA